jgi:septation ring formation regulator EzrA
LNTINIEIVTVRSGLDDVVRELPGIRDTARGVTTMINEMPVLKGEMTALHAELSTVSGTVTTIHDQLPVVSQNVAAINDEIPQIRDNVTIIRDELPALRNLLEQLSVSFLG